MEGSQKLFENGCFFCGTSNILYIANAKLFPLGIKLSYLQSDMKTIGGKLVDFEKRIQNWSGMGGGGGGTPPPPPPPKKKTLKKNLKIKKKKNITKKKKCKVSKMLLMTKNDYIGPKRELLKKEKWSEVGWGVPGISTPAKSTKKF